MKKTITYSGISILLIILTFRFTCGVLVIPPLGLLPKGSSIVYVRVNLDLPFIASADGILKERDGGVSIFSRGILLGELGEKLKKRVVFRLPYSKDLYLYSTNGTEYEK